MATFFDPYVGAEIDMPDNIDPNEANRAMAGLYQQEQTRQAIVGGMGQLGNIVSDVVSPTQQYATINPHAAAAMTPEVYQQTMAAQQGVVNQQNEIAARQEMQQADIAQQSAVEAGRRRVEVQRLLQQQKDQAAEHKLREMEAKNLDAYRKQQLEIKEREFKMRERESKLPEIDESRGVAYYTDPETGEVTQKIIDPKIHARATRVAGTGSGSQAAPSGSITIGDVEYPAVTDYIPGVGPMYQGPDGRLYSAKDLRDMQSGAKKPLTPEQQQLSDIYDSFIEQEIKGDGVTSIDERMKNVARLLAEKEEKLYGKSTASGQGASEPPLTPAQKGKARQKGYDAVAEANRQRSGRSGAPQKFSSERPDVAPLFSPGRSYVKNIHGGYKLAPEGTPGSAKYIGDGMWGDRIPMAPGAEVPEAVAPPTGAQSIIISPPDQPLNIAPEDMATGRMLPTITPRNQFPTVDIRR